MLPLRGLVILPSYISTIEVGRAKSLKAVEISSLMPNKEIFVVSQQNIADEEASADRVYSVGTVCRILKISEYEDSISVKLEGLYAAKISQCFDKQSYLEVSLEKLVLTNIDTIRAEALVRKCRELVAQLAVMTNRISKEQLIELADDLPFDTLANKIIDLFIASNSTKQKLLEITNIEIKLESLFDVLAREVEISKVDRKIANKVKKSIEKGQREYYLKEQMKAISDELGEGEEEVSEWTRKITEANMPEDVTEKALKEVRRLSKMSITSPDAAVIRTYLEWLCDLKWNYSTVDNKDLKLARQILNEDHYGLEKIKERILEYLAVMQLTDSLKSPILCFVGPPGVGKTSIVKSIARALGRNYVRMSLGGVRDEAEIRGHRRTYIGAIPGKIIYLLKQAGCNNPVMLFDEIDKMSSDFRGDPASAMLEVLDPEQNNSFSDHYLEVPFDLSKTMFVATANSIEGIPSPLLDRMEIIELSGYTQEEKISIAQQFLIPKQVANHGIESLVIDNTTIDAIISGYTREAGVRSLEREIASICRKVALQEVEQDGIKTNTITSENLAKYIGSAKYLNDEVNKGDFVGTATGLAWTAVGGTTLTIEVTLFKGKGEIILTGKLGDVMKESARTAISLVRSKAAEYNIDTELFSTTDIHIHIPEGAIPKDGPSAGITLATAILSAFSNRKVSHSVAMTGEVTLRGRVLAIGGLKEKLLAAYRAGVKTVIIPKDNSKDITEIPNSILEQMSIIQVSDIATVFDSALV